MKAAVFSEAHQPLTVEQVDIDSPIGAEVLVRVVATGLCHSDVHFLDGHLSLAAWGNGGRAVLGHEGAGVVEAVGPDVTSVQPGDHVIACLSAFCGKCEQCLTGNPARCASGVAARPAGAKPRLTLNGEPLIQFVNLGTFAEQMLVHENGLVKVDPGLPLDRAALLGCGVTTGVGAALNTAQVRPGSTVAVFGCGGVGLSVVNGAMIAGARQIIAVDMLAPKLEMATNFGATHTVDASAGNAPQAVRELTGGRGVDYAFEAVGAPSLVPQMLESLASGGTATVVGVMPIGATYNFPAALLGGEKKLQTCTMGSNRFRIDIPQYIDLYRQGRLKLDDMVTRVRPIEEINDAVRAMKAGEVARTVLTFE